jgi:hypothetical protein
MILDHLKKRLSQVKSRDQIYKSENTEKSIIEQLHNSILSTGFVENNTNVNQNYGFSNSYQRKERRLAYRFVDSLFFGNPEVWNWDDKDVIVTDNVSLRPVNCKQILVLPEFWHIYSCKMIFKNRVPTHGYNCFMNRISGDRSQVFYELIRRNILDKGQVSFNCWRPGDGRNSVTVDYTINNYTWQYEQAEMFQYVAEHQKGLELIPYCTIDENEGLVQVIINSNVSLILETYTSDSHIVFSEKVFRALQLPRPWLLSCSPGSVKLLKDHGFDVLDDYVDINYDSIPEHSHRLLKILDQLETFIDRKYTEQDYQRFELAAKHNQALLSKFEQCWPEKFNTILNEIKNYD